MEFREFILAHDGDDLGRLALARNRYAGEVPDFDLALTTLECRRKLRDKVPEWYAVPSLRYPFRLSAEQCSSAETARYKASVAFSAVSSPLPTGRPVAGAKTPPNAPDTGLEAFNGSNNGPECSRRGPFRLADLTGGLGVDSWAFAQLFDAVLYNEMRPELAAAAALNFQELGMDNITVRNCQLGKGFPVKPGMTKPVISGGGPEGGQGVMACSEGAPGVMAGFDRPSVGVLEVLDGFRPDILYLDPARRAADGRKVFRLEDCQPDVLQLLPELLEACPKLLLKLSPMADITLVCKQLGCVKEVHVVAAEGECKELLLLLEKGQEAPYRLLVWEDGTGLEIPRSAQNDNGERSDDGSISARGALLFEPGKGLLKAGAFELPCQLGLKKLGRHTHLYAGDQIPEALRPFGKVFEILEVQPLNNKTMKELGRRYPQAEVTARNLPLSSDQLRAKLGVHSGGNLHIFGIKADTIPSSILASALTPTPASAMATTTPTANLLLVTKRGDK